MPTVELRKPNKEKDLKLYSESFELRRKTSSKVGTNRVHTEKVPPAPNVGRLSNSQNLLSSVRLIVTTICGLSTASRIRPGGRWSVQIPNFRS